MNRDIKNMIATLIANANPKVTLQHAVINPIAFRIAAPISIVNINMTIAINNFTGLLILGSL